MENLKEHLLNKTNKNIEEKKEELNNLEEELEMLKAEIKVEKRLLEMEHVPDEIKEGREYFLKGMQDRKVQEEEKIDNIEEEIEALNYKKRVLKKFDEQDLKA